jgi:feruloyl esterase
MVYNNPNWNFETFNFDSDVTYSDQGFSALLDAINPDLRAFHRHGGKILQSHLWNSVVHPAARSIEYYEQVVGLMKGDTGRKTILENRDFHQTQEFYRLFMGPGGTGSKGPGTFDSMPYLEAWVEQGVAPASVLASHLTNGVVDRARPLCPYPAFAVYNGSGSTDEAASFECHEPGQVPNYFVLDGPAMDDPYPPRQSQP